MQLRRCTYRFMQINPSSSCIISSSIGAAVATQLRGDLKFNRQSSAFVPLPSNIVYRSYCSSSQVKSIGSLFDNIQQPMSEEEITLLRQRKQTLRKEVRKCIKETYPACETEKLLTQSNLVFSRLFSLPQYKSAKSIGFFLSMPSFEIQTRDAICRIVSDGKTLYVPRVGLDFEKCDMDLIRAETTSESISNEEDDIFYDAWPKNKWNIPEPPVESDASNIAHPGDIDLLLVPGLAFDVNGHRLGQGKGYYDRFISKMRDGDKEISSGEVKPLLVGVCLQEQFLNKDGFEGIPVTDHDFIMDMVITPTETLVVGS